MNKFVKKTTVAILLGSLIMSLGILTPIALAEEADIELTPDSLSLEESIEYTLEHSEDLALIYDKVELSKQALDEAQDQYNELQRGELNTSSMDNLKRALINNQYYIMSAQLDYDKAIEEYESAKEQISYDATQKFYQLLLAQDNLESATTSYTRAQDSLKIVNLKYQLGDATSLDVVQAKNSLVEAENDMQTQKESLHIKQMEWYLFLGLSYDEDVQSEGTWTNLSIPDLTEFVNPSEFGEVVEESFTVKSAAEELDLEALQYESFLNIYRKVNKDYEQYKYQYDQAENSYQESLNQTWLSIYSDYYNLQEKNRSYLESEANLAYQEDIYRLQELKYSLGEVSLDSLLSAEQTLYKTTLQNNQQKMELLLLALDWQNQYQ
ncbi:TolC family protein [Clostridia bacterium]|nr:TolC family protein [Clostridia bacterium]